ncbi:carboxypeptidase regulatory-like domain-containing protein [Nannocystaceae bacterium ST9]
MVDAPTGSRLREAALPVLALLWVLVATVITLVVGPRTHERDEVETRGSTELPGITEPTEVGPHARLEGVVLRELPIVANGIDPATSGDDSRSASDSDSSLATDTSETGSDETSAGEPDEGPVGEAPGLAPPLPGTCEVRAWQAGRRVAGPVGCDERGGYRLELEPAVVGTVAVELIIPGHLRGVVEVEVASPIPEPAIVVPTVALGPGFRIAGLTLDGRGQPLADVNVQAQPQPSLDEPEPWRTRSDGEGRFEFTTLPYGPISLRAIRPGFALAVVEAIAPEDEVLLILDALIDLEGSVVASPELLARAKVRLEGSSVWPALERPLDPAGAFVFEGLPDGIYGVEVQVLAEQPGEREWASIPLENVTPDLRVSLALIEAFRVPVRVVDGEGLPIADARVTIGYGQLGMLQKIALTEGGGQASAGPVVPGPYLLWADADGYLPSLPVELDIGDEGFVGEAPTLVLVRPARIEGLVVDADDRPVAGAEVLLDSEVEFSIGEGQSRSQLFALALEAGRAPADQKGGSLGVTEGEVPDIPLFGAEQDEDPSIGSVISDEDGKFVIDLLPGTHAVWAIDGEHAASAVERFELASGDVVAGVRLRLREGVRLTGVARAGNGQPIAGVQVDLGDGLVLTTDERGVFDAGFRRGDQRLVLRAPGMIPRAIDLELDDAPVDLDVELEPARGRYEGRVVDGNGQPIADVEVELHPLDGLSPSLLTWTDARGVYQFDELTPGSAELSFEHADYVPAELRAKIGETTSPGEELVLDTGWTAEVLVRSAGRGDPIADVDLVAGHVGATTDREGAATLTRLVGTVDIVATAAGWTSETLRVGDDGTGRVLLTIELAQGGAIEGQIDDDIGDPVVGAAIEIRTLDDELIGEARSDARGRWRVDGVPEGDVRIHAEPPPGLEAVLAPIDERSDVLRGEVTDLRLRFDKL